VLSPHLKFGTLSCRLFYARLQQARRPAACGTVRSLACSDAALAERDVARWNTGNCYGIWKVVTAARTASPSSPLHGLVQGACPICPDHAIACAVYLMHTPPFLTMGALDQLHVRVCVCR